MKTFVILNPYANRWTAGKRKEDLIQSLDRAGLAHKLVVSEHRGHILDLARRATNDGYSTIVVAGGDGSIGEAINGIVQAAGKNSLPKLGVMPMGTANDFAFNLNLSTDLRQAARAIAADQVRRIDLGQVNDRYFVNNSAVGLEPYVSLKQQRISWLKGTSRYMLAAVQGILDRPAWHANLSWDYAEFEGPVSLVTIGNGARSGGFFMAPHAVPTDGKLTAVFGYRQSAREMLTLLPKALNPNKGNYSEAVGFREIDFTYLDIFLTTPSPAHVDGEIFTLDTQVFKYRVHPGRVPLVC